MLIRKATAEDAEGFIALRSLLFQETNLMLREVHEYHPTAAAEAAYIDSLANAPHSTLLLALEAEETVGFICASGNSLVRKRHVATVFLGVVRRHWGKGVATAMLQEVIAWAPDADIERLELTVGVDNPRAKELYERMGFMVEGTARGAMKIDDVLKDEFVMGLLV